MPLKNIICSTDFSDNSNQAVPYGIALAKKFRARLYMCHVIDLSAITAYGEIISYPGAQQNLIMNYTHKQLKQLIGEEPIEWEPLIIIGHAADEIVNMAKEKNVDLTIVTTHGRSGLKRLILGSVTGRLMQTLPCPLLIVRSSESNLASDENQEIEFKRILVGCDFSPDSVLAFQYGLSLAQDFQSELHLAHVIEPTIYKDLTKKPVEKPQDDLRDSLSKRLTSMVPEEVYNWCTLKTTLLAGQPHEELTKYAVVNDVDLIVLGVRGHSMVETLFVGSTTDRVARRALCPVLSVRAAIQDV
jgi:Universal stress protein UspA and related nucleotide-binding proteins